MTLDKNTVLEALKQVYDPELGVNVVDLGLVYDLNITEDGNISVTMTLTTPGCPMHDTISGGVRSRLQNLPGVKNVQVRVVWDPPWTPDRITPAGREALGMF